MITIDLTMLFVWFLALILLSLLGALFDYATGTVPKSDNSLLRMLHYIVHAAIGGMLALYFYFTVMQ